MKPYRGLLAFWFGPAHGAECHYILPTTATCGTATTSMPTTAGVGIFPKVVLAPKQAHNQWTNGRFTAVELEE